MNHTYPWIIDINLGHLVDEWSSESNEWRVQKGIESVVPLLVIQNQTFREHAGLQHGLHPCQAAARAIHFARGKRYGWGGEHGSNGNTRVGWGRGGEYLLAAADKIWRVAMDPAIYIHNWCLEKKDAKSKTNEVRRIVRWSVGQWSNEAHMSNNFSWLSVPSQKQNW
jgi:hypothetical protein